MATYKGIKGFSIQNLSADPSNPIEGEMWYNSTSNVWKESTLTTTGAWATSNNMNTARAVLGGAGTQTAGLAFGGGTPITTGATEEYDGNSWTNSNSMNTVRGLLGGAGTQTAALAFGGYKGSPPPTSTNASDEYDGTNWTAGASTLVEQNANINAGTQTDAYQFTGYNGSNPIANTSNYDGTAWATNVNLGTAISSSGGSTGQGSGFSQIQGGGSTPAGSSQTTSQEFTGETVAATASTLTTS